MKVRVIYLLESTNMKVSGQKLMLLGVHIDRALSFDEHVSNLCKKVGQVI